MTSCTRTVRNTDSYDQHPGAGRRHKSPKARVGSVSITCRDLSLIAATLANGGVNPVTHERAIRGGFVERIHSVMTTCGMYDSAGEWMYSVGLPSKSGVSGGLMVILPGQLGIGVFSPRVDSHGNSVRGLPVCQDLSRECELHVVRVARSARSAIRARYTLSTVRSKRLRPQSEGEALTELGNRAAVYELQGDLLFAAMEAVVRAIVAQSDSVRLVVRDIGRVTVVTEPAARLLLELLACMEASSRQFVLVGVQQQHPRLLRFLQERTAAQDERGRVRVFAYMDLALEWCEHRLLEEASLDRASPVRVELADHPLCRGLERDSLLHLDRMLEHRRYAAGEYILRSGTDAESVYLLVNGDVSITVPPPNGHPRRLVTLSAGMTFGELAVINQATRSADVRANSAVECRVLPLTVLQRLTDSHPRIGSVPLKNMLRNALQTVERLTREVAALTR